MICFACHRKAHFNAARQVKTSRWCGPYYLPFETRRPTQTAKQNVPLGIRPYNRCTTKQSSVACVHGLLVHGFHPSNTLIQAAAAQLHGNRRILSPVHAAFRSAYPSSLMNPTDKWGDEAREEDASIFVAA
jgi:hypothetical protein